MRVGDNFDEVMARKSRKDYVSNFIFIVTLKIYSLINMLGFKLSVLIFALKDLLYIFCLIKTGNCTFPKDFSFTGNICQIRKFVLTSLIFS